MSIQSPLGVNRLARTKEVLGITALEAATPVTNAGAEGVVTAASYAAAGAAVDTATNIVHILGLGTFEATTESVTGATAGNPDDANEHDGTDNLVFEVSTGVFKLFEKKQDKARLAIGPTLHREYDLQGAKLKDLITGGLVSFPNGAGLAPTATSEGLYFDGVENYIDITVSLDQSDFAAGFLVKLENSGEIQAIFGGYSPPGPLPNRLLILANGDVQAMASNSAKALNRAYHFNEWQFIGMRVSGGTLTIRVGDAEFDYTDTFASQTITSLRLGSMAGQTYRMQGVMRYAALSSGNTTLEQIHQQALTRVPEQQIKLGDHRGIYVHPQDNLQNAITEACRHRTTVFFDNAAYNIANTINIADPLASSNQSYCNLKGGANTVLTWSGGSSKSIFAQKGGKLQKVEDLQVVCQSGDDVVVFELFTDGFYTSTGFLRYEGVQINFGTNENCIGYKAGSLDVAGNTWLNCVMIGTDNTRGHVGWQTAGGNNLAWNLLGCTSYYMGKAVNTPSGGGGSIYVYGMNGSHNLIDFNFEVAQNYLISGGRFELGGTFLRGGGGGGKYSLNATVIGAEISSYATAILNAQTKGEFVFQNCFTPLATGGASDLGENLFQLDGFDGGVNPASLQVKNSSFADQATKLFTVNSEGWLVNFENVKRRAANGDTSEFIDYRQVESIAQTTNVSLTGANNESVAINSSSTDIDVSLADRHKFKIKNTGSAVLTVEGVSVAAGTIREFIFDGANYIAF